LRRGARAAGSGRGAAVGSLRWFGGRWNGSVKGEEEVEEVVVEDMVGWQQW
jgi:hypothetical protein